LTAERSDGSTLPEGGIDLDISRPSTSFVTKVSKEFIKRSWQRYMPAICRTPMFSEARKELRVSLRKLTKQVGDLREENKKVKQELKVSKARSKWLSDKVDHLKDVIKELVDINLISEDALKYTYMNGF
ncbi:hypothetical protein NQ318_017332, partial [Aromia moschata]